MNLRYFWKFYGQNISIVSLTIGTAWYIKGIANDFWTKYEKKRVEKRVAKGLPPVDENRSFI